MSQRAFNFSAGPSTLPLSVLEKCAAELTCYEETGVSILELGHRTETFKDVTQQATDRIRKILQVPNSYDVFFIQGGGRLVFSVLPMNFCIQPDSFGQYLVTGAWGKAAFGEAEKAGKGQCVWNGKDTNFSHIPSVEDLQIDPNAAFLHYTSNETIEGVQFPFDLKAKLQTDVPIICDVSSDFMSRPIDINNYDMIYACIQKNLGPAGATLVIAKRELLEKAPDSMPGYLRFLNHANADSMYNTPPVFCIYVANLVLQWFEETFGDLEAIGQFNREKSQLVYQALLESPQLYQLHAAENCRSMMNVTFRLPNEATEKSFLQQAQATNLAYLAGHRSVGGMRASLYNAMPIEGAQALAQFIREFANNQ